MFKIPMQTILTLGFRAAELVLYTISLDIMIKNALFCHFEGRGSRNRTVLGINYENRSISFTKHKTLFYLLWQTLWNLTRCPADSKKTGNVPTKYIELISISTHTNLYTHSLIDIVISTYIYSNSRADTYVEGSRAHASVQINGMGNKDWHHSITKWAECLEMPYHCYCGPLQISASRERSKERFPSL